MSLKKGRIMKCKAKDEISEPPSFSLQPSGHSRCCSKLSEAGHVSKCATESRMLKAGSRSQRLISLFHSLRPV